MVSNLPLLDKAVQTTAYRISTIIPAKNEADSLLALLPRLRQLYPSVEIIVVNDGSTDETEAVARSAGARVISHPYSMGNGAAIKSGARNAAGDILVFMDADGQHDPQYIDRLLGKLAEGYEMVIGARDRASQASFMRWVGNGIYNWLASWVVGHPIADLTSGMRVARAGKFREFLHMLPNGFSYPTTSTMAFFRAGYSVAFVPIPVQKRTSKRGSHIRMFRDGSRFFLIIFRVATLYSPLKIFAPLSAMFFLLGCSYLSFTLLTTGRFTNFSGLLFITSVLIFLIGLVSEQITNLLYTKNE
jgi:glycosyltransferase involved in cell wall biosynthesis